ncbi:uncharacterized protein PADG_04243 [Paracoccidioides brasiliensis Pb18]|uniref:Transcriptional regulator n=1 Tax=Paracoccidioides brasiliensis (strain Pb18) TaxID=502780 RepID=C1GAF7_PARBD|nr:uncharacterized protein PADG_04243 [Paracoccidioides brasiliensis Pb18]EEH48159.2 hypothetical protein PADG_04243 [Paracoccidioides brasiliensis Pb18]ODH50543.1 hypothetical protein GX48_03361 [Paracoccidioides brasiliensis]
MADSESESESLSSTGIPSENILEMGLRDTVAGIFKKGNMEDLTVKRVRIAAEKALDLEEGFYKNDAVWKAKSDWIIKQEAEKQEELAARKEEKREQPASPVPPKRVASLKKPRASKRSATGASQPSRKRRRIVTPSESEELSSPPSEDSEVEDEDEEAPRSRKQAPLAKEASGPEKQAPQTAPPKRDSSSELSDAPDESKKSSERELSEDDTSRKEPDDAKQDASESELSVLIDDEPEPKTKRRKSSEPSKAGKSTKQKPSSKSKNSSNVDPDQEEIKKLQGQLAKCGIRKMWFRELAPYDTARAKVKHLRQMLKDAGMGGRFSLEKAKAIREQRELLADLEVVREGARRWGTNISDEEAGEGRPRRRVARGFQALSFLGDDDGEETD